MTKVYKMFYGRFKESSYEVSEEERNAALAKLDERLEQVGARRLVFCYARWWSDEWQWFGLEEFPDIEAVQKYAQYEEELMLFRYIESMSMLGTEIPMAALSGP